MPWSRGLPACFARIARETPKREQTIGSTTSEFTSRVAILFALFTVTSPVRVFADSAVAVHCILSLASPATPLESLALEWGALLAILFSLHSE